MRAKPFAKQKWFDKAYNRIMNKLFRYSLATFCFLIAALTLYAFYIITENEDTMRNFEGTTSFNFHGLAITVIGLILTVLITFIGYKVVLSAKNVK